MPGQIRGVSTDPPASGLEVHPVDEPDLPPREWCEFLDEGGMLPGFLVREIRHLNHEVVNNLP